ncbi:MAG TPA: cysteine desulfurase [Chthonomonadales bacterium]|nr:cysteine desulfurase [Chthonomonadales bacterium]
MAMVGTREDARADARPVAALDVERVRADFPILSRTVRGKPLVYLDNAATTQKPRAVIDTLRRYYEDGNANIHRGVHLLSQTATEQYERARRGVQRLLNAPHLHEVIFTRGTTEAVNLVAASFGRRFVGQGDEIVLTEMEHHSNIVPWQMLCEQVGARIRVAPIDDRGALRMDAFEALLNERTRLVSVVHVSNALGTVNSIGRICELAHAAGAKVMVDGAQAAPHLRPDVRALGCDFYALSGHKLFGPTGIGALWGREELLDQMPPWQGGGDMIEQVSFERTTYNTLPAKFEAGTPHIAGAIGLGAAIDYVESIGYPAIAAHEQDLIDYATAAIGDVPGVRITGTAPGKASVLSFVMESVHPHDIGTILDSEGVAVRTGHHCCQPLMRRLGVPATARASFALYNTRVEVDAFIRALGKVREVMG